MYSAVRMYFIYTQTSSNDLFFFFFFFRMQNKRFTRQNQHLHQNPDAHSVSGVCGNREGRGSPSRHGGDPERRGAFHSHSCLQKSSQGSGWSGRQQAREQGRRHHDTGHRALPGGRPGGGA